MALTLTSGQYLPLPRGLSLGTAEPVLLLQEMEGWQHLFEDQALEVKLTPAQRTGTRPVGHLGPAEPCFEGVSVV